MDSIPIFSLTMPSARSRQRRQLVWLESCPCCTSTFVYNEDLRAPNRNYSAPINGRIHRYDRYGVNDFSLAEYSCLLGHHLIWQKIISSKISWALIIEDDAKPVNQNWWRDITALAQCIETSALASTSWVVNIGISCESLKTLALKPLKWRTYPSNVTSVTPEVGELDIRLGDVWKTFSYLISIDAAKNLLAHEELLPWTADDWSMRLSNNSLQHMLVTTRPLFVECEDLPSQIQHHSKPMNLLKISRIKRKIITLLYRIGFGAVYY